MLSSRATALYLEKSSGEIWIRSEIVVCEIQVSTYSNIGMHWVHIEVEVVVDH